MRRYAQTKHLCRVCIKSSLFSSEIAMFFSKSLRTPQGTDFIDYDYAVERVVLWCSSVSESLQHDSVQALLEK